MPRTIRLHDTRTGKVLPVEPDGDGVVGIYTCGPTVYGRIHVGNARPYVVFSLLARLLVHDGYKVTFVTNITDVNDKIYAAAQTAGVGSEQLAREMSDAYVADTDRLGLGRPDHEPRASATIAEIVELIEELIESGHAYPVDGDVYFSVRSYPRYGEISHRDIDEMDQGEGVEGAERKRDPADFALWKAEKPGEDTAWDAPWGRGRPGWHIECSAMAEELLGVGFEIHGGGADLIFPHHENEAAQTCAAHGAPLARLWVHNGMVRLDQAKMSKSVGNIFLLHQALDAYGRDALLMHFCGGHYRQPVEFDDERLAEARARRADRRGRPTADPGAFAGVVGAVARAVLRRPRRLDRDAVRGHRSACAVGAIDGLVRIAQTLRPCDRQRRQRDGARADSHTAARLAESRHISSPILGGGVRVGQTALREGFTNTTKTEEVSKLAQSQTRAATAWTPRS